MTGSLDKRIYLMIMSAITISGFIVICTLGQSLHRQKIAAKISAVPPEAPAVVSVVREYNGRIGVFKDESSVPYRIIDYDLKLLSDYDREQLSHGVTLTSERELQQFIEDIAT